MQGGYMKILGVIIVLLSAWGIGSSLIARINQQEKQLVAFREMIDLFLGEIRYGKTPLIEACDRLGKRLIEPYASSLESIAGELKKKQYVSFQEVWKNRFLSHQKDFLLGQEQFDTLLSMGKYLGILDVEAQLRHLEFLTTQVDGYISQLQRISGQQKKVYRSVSLMVGAMVLLLFL